MTDLTIDAGGQVWPSDDRGHVRPVPPLKDRQAAARHGRFVPVRLIGAIRDMDGELLRIGIDHDTVTIGARRFTLAQVEEVAQVLVSAVWAAGANAAAMAAEASDG